MDSYSSSEVYIPELHTPTKRTEFGSIIRKLWTKIALAKLGSSLSTSKIPFLSVNEPSDELQEVYKSKSESATFSLKIDMAEPSLINESGTKSHKDLRATTANYSLPDISDSGLFLPSPSLEGLLQTNSLFDPNAPCSSKQIPLYDPDNLDDNTMKIQQYQSKVQILRLSERSDDNSAVIWRTGATRDFPQTVIEDDLHLLKSKLKEVFGHDAETPSAGPEAGKVITSRAYVPALPGYEDFSCSAYYTDAELAAFAMEFQQDKAIQVDLRDGIRRDTEGLRVAPFGWLYLQRVGSIDLVDYRVSISIVNIICTRPFDVWIFSCPYRRRHSCIYC